MAKPKQRYGICIVRVCSMTYESAAQPLDGAMLPPCAATRCFATVTQSHTNAIRYLCGDGENAWCQAFTAPIRGQACPRSTASSETGAGPMAAGCLRAP